MEIKHVTTTFSAYRNYNLFTENDENANRKLKVLKHWVATAQTSNNVKKKGW